MQCDRFTEQEKFALAILSTTPIKSRELGAIIGTKDAETRAIIRELRLKGVKVCSGSEGFWMWDGKDDSWTHTKRQIFSRTKALWDLWKAMENAPMEEQVRWNV